MSLPNGKWLLPGEKIVSDNERVEFEMQEDGNLVVYHGATARWASDTQGCNVEGFVVQEDGNACIYDKDHQGHRLWGSGTDGKGGSDTYLAVQDDGNVVLYPSADSKAIWATNTNTLHTVDDDDNEDYRFNWK